MFINFIYFYLFKRERVSDSGDAPKCSPFVLRQYSYVESKYGKYSTNELNIPIICFILFIF